MKTRRSTAAFKAAAHQALACIVGVLLAVLPVVASAQMPVRTNALSLVDNLSGHTLTLAPPSPMTGDQTLVFPSMRNGAAFMMSNSLAGQSLANGLLLTGSTHDQTNALLTVAPLIPGTRGTYYGVLMTVAGTTGRGVTLIAINATASGTSDLAIGGSFAATGSGNNIGARFTASGGSSNTGIEVTAGGAKISGGIDNNAGGITEAGTISGVTSLAAESVTVNGVSTSTMRLDPQRISFTDGSNKSLELRYTAGNDQSLSVIGGALRVGSSGEFSVSSAGVVRAAKLSLGEPLAAADGGTGVNASSVSARKIFASPSNASGAATFRALELSDLPDLGARYISNSTSATQPSSSFNIDGNGAIGGNLVVAGSGGLSLSAGATYPPVISFGDRTADRTLQFKDGSGNTLATIIDRGTTGAINASAGFQIAGSAASGSMLRGNGTDYVASTATYPNTTAQNQLLYSASDNKIAGLPTSGNGVLITNTSGVPAIASMLPANVQKNITALGAISSGTWSGTPISDENVENKLTINGGSINATPVGITTAASGAFTGLSANGTVTFSSLKSGIVRSNANGVLSSSPISNADISSNAAISGSKISADFGSQEIRTSGGLNITAGTVTLGNANTTVNIPGLLATGSVAPTALVTPNVYGGLASGSTLNLEGSNHKTPSGDRVTITTDNTIRATIDASGTKLGGNLSFTGGRVIAPVASATGYSLTLSAGDATDRNDGGKLTLSGGKGSTTGGVEINASGGNIALGDRSSSTTIAGALNVNGGIHNNRGGITDVGAISGVTSISASELTISSFTRPGVVHNDSRGELVSGQVDLAEDVSGVLATESGGTGSATVAPNLLFAGPAAGVADGAPTFRKLSAGDLPPSSGNYIQNQNTGSQSGAAFNIDGSGIIGGKMVVRGNAILGDSVSDNVSLLGLVNTSLNFAAGGDRSISVATSPPSLAGNSLTINAGNAGAVSGAPPNGAVSTGSGNGGSLSINGGDASGGIAGSVNINGGVSATSTGGSLIALAGTTVSGTGGSSVFAGGDASGAGSGGPTIIRGGHSKSSNSGTVSIHGGLVDGNAPSTVNINTTGTSGGNVMIGNGATMLTLNSANIDISPGGAITGATGITSSGAITFSSLTNGIVKSRNGNLTASELDVEEMPGELATDQELELAINTAVRGKQGKLAIFTATNAVGDGDLRGDVTTNGSMQTSLSSTGVTAGNYGSGSSVATFTVDAKGRVSSAGNTLIKAAASDLSGNTLAPTVTASSLQSVGTITSGTWRATPIADAFVANDLTIAGGKIDGTDIGRTSPRDGFFTGVSSNGVISGAGLLTLGNDEAKASQGKVVLEDGAALNTFDATISTIGELSDDRTYTLPDASGTFALVESLGRTLSTQLVQADDRLTLKAKSVHVASSLAIDGELKVGNASAPFASRAKITATKDGSQKFTIKNSQSHPMSMIIVTPVTSDRGLVVPIAIDDQSVNGQFDILVNDMLKGETLQLYYLIIN